MKTKTILSILLASILCVGFTSCSDDDEKSDKPQPTDERDDDLSSLTASLLRDVFDDDGKTIVKRIPSIGKAIYESSPTEYYVCVEDLDEAKESFLNMVPENIEIINIADNYTLNLKDAKGAAEGNVYFSALSENEDGYLAQVTFSPEDMFPEISKIIYVQDAYWPAKGFQANSPYKYLKTANVKDSKHGNPRGLCIRECTDKDNGIIIIPLTKEAGYYSLESNCTDNTLHAFAKYIKDKKIANEVDKALAALSLGKLDKYYWSYNKYGHGLWNNIYTVNLKTDDSIRHTEWGVGTNSNTGMNFLGYYFNSKGDCW